VLIEEIQRALPGEFGRGFVVAWRRVVVESVIRAFVQVCGVGDVVGFQRFLLSGPARSDARVQRRITKKARKKGPGRSPFLLETAGSSGKNFTPSCFLGREGRSLARALSVRNTVAAQSPLSAAM
jgi:hypothetical protein